MSGIQESDYKTLNSITSLNDNDESDMNFDDPEYAGSIDLSRNIPRKHDTLQVNHQQINEENEIFTEKRINPSVFASFQSLERYFNTQAYTQQDKTLNNCIIQDSDKDYSSSSDMFRDSSTRQESNNEMKNGKDYELLEENDLVIEKSTENFSLPSPNSGILSKTLLKTKEDLVVSSDDSDFSDITVFHEGCSSYEENCGQMRRQLTSESNGQIVSPLTQTCSSNFRNKNPVILSNQSNVIGSPQRDSAYDTYRSSVECTPTSNCICENKDVSIFSSPKIDNITPYQKDESGNDTHNLEFLAIDKTEEDWISEQNGPLSLSSSPQKSNRSTNSITIEYNNLAKSCIPNRHPQKCKNSIKDGDKECEGSGKKRRKLQSVDEFATAETTKEGEEKISSQWLKFTLDSLDVDDVAFQSAKVILSILQNERIARQYMRKRCWKGTLEEQAVDAVLNFRDVFEAGNKTNRCTQEIVQMVTGILDKSIGAIELNKVSILTHQISITLQLCTSMQVCVEVINHLTTKLKSYENILVSLTNSKKANVHSVINQLHIIFYALMFCLQKYRSVFCNKEANQFEEEMIPPVIDLWKKQLNFEGVIIEDDIQTRERRWLMILDDFAVAATETFIQFAKKARKLADLLARE